MLITLSDIVADPRIQPRASLNQSHVNNFAQLIMSGMSLEPVVIFNDGNVYWLSDGFHRFAAHQLAGASLIHADVHAGSQRDAFLFAVEKNATHGLPLSLAERKQAALRLLLDDEWSKWSANQIGKLCGLYHKTIEKLRAALDVNAQSLYASSRDSGTSSQMLQSVSWEIPKIRNLTKPSLSQPPSQMLQSVSWEIPKIQNLTDPSLSQVPSRILQSVSLENPKIQNLTDDPKPSPITRKATRNGKEYLINTSNIGRSRSPKAVQSQSNHCDTTMPDLSQLPDLIDDTVIIPPQDSDRLRLDPNIVETTAETITEIPTFSLLDIEWSKQILEKDLSEYNLILLATDPINALPLILQQMQRVPTFAANVLQQAQQLAEANTIT